MFRFYPSIITAILNLSAVVHAPPPLLNVPGKSFDPALYAATAVEVQMSGMMSGQRMELADWLSDWGDYFAITECHCKHDRDMLGHILQFEYFNIHFNTTFFMDKNWHEKDDALHYTICRSFGTPSKLYPRKKMCIKRRVVAKEDSLDLEWDGQHRELLSEGGQGRYDVPKDRVDREICPPMCRDYMEFEGKATDATGTGIQWVWVRIDDM